MGGWECCCDVGAQGSDGIWEFITSQEAMDMVAGAKDVKDAVDKLCEEATKRWRAEEDVIDDITCIVIELNDEEDKGAMAASGGAAAAAGGAAVAATRPAAGKSSATAMAPSPTAARAPVATRYVGFERMKMIGVCEYACLP